MSVVRVALYSPLLILIFLNNSLFHISSPGLNIFETLRHLPLSDVHIQVLIPLVAIQPPAPGSGQLLLYTTFQVLLDPLCKSINSRHPFESGQLSNVICLN